MMPAHPTLTDGIWRVMRFEREDGKYVEVASNEVGPEAIPVPQGYRLASVTPMAPADQHAALADRVKELEADLHEARAVLRAARRILRGEDDTTGGTTDG